MSSEKSANCPVPGGVLYDGATVDALAGCCLEGGVSAEAPLEREFEARLADCSTLAFRVALAVLHHREDAEDVAQEALVRAYRNFHRLRDRERFRPWLVRITWRMALDRRRGAARRSRHEAATGAPAAPDGAEDLAASREFQRHLERAIAELPGKLRIVMVLAAIQGYDTREVAGLLELPEGTVKSRLHAARKRLAEKLRWAASGTKTG
jgi:RNA polymerase sigma-70 factor (ECF subfamily)